MLQPLQDPSKRFFDQVVTPPSYIVFQEGGRIYAKNGKTGQIEFSGTDASAVIQSAINALPASGGKIVLKSGIYLINSTIFYKKDYLWLAGEGQSTVLKLADGKNCDVLSADRRNNKGVILENFRINGNKTNNTSGRGLVFTGYYSFLNNIEIHDCAGNGFEAQRPVGTTESMVDNFVFNIRTYRNDGIGFIWGTETGGAASDNYFVNIISWGNKGDGIVLEAPSLYCWNINSYSNDGNGIVIKGSQCQIMNAVADSNKKHGFVLYRTGAWLTKIIFGRAINNSGEGAGLYDGFILDGDGQYVLSRATLIDCYAFDNRTPKLQNWGVNYVYQSSDSRNLVIGGYFAGNLQPAGVKVSGLILRAKYVLAPLFENSGTATITAGSTYVDVTHGLAITPDINRIKVLPKDNLSGRSFWVSDVGATTFRINISSADTVDHVVGWSYE